jgi:adenylylsulfate kinase-like enzyme
LALATLPPRPPSDHGITALVSAVSPYRAVRDEVRAAAGRVDDFAEVHVATEE